MRRRRKLHDLRRGTLTKLVWWEWEMFWILRWWILAVYLSAVLPCCCSVHVFVRDEKRYAVLFQSVVLPCQYTSVSTQTPVVQWVYKSYCRDRTRDSFSFSDSLGGGLGGGLSGGHGGITGTGTGYGGNGGYGTHGGYGGVYETGTASYLDCADSSRTVRTVASVSGSSITLSEYYKNRDISIINKADLRIGEVQWGDSGVYICKVVISDDLEGQNEASVELLVLEWVFVSAVALGSVLFLLLVGICWCQCCPHSCCCYVSCWCCPETCCCPRHLYEAGKGIKTGTSTPAYPPYFVSGVPAMVPIAPPSLVDKVSIIPSTNGTQVTGKIVPMHAVGAPYRVPSQQDQNSLRVLQYVEKQLAHFNPARSTSHHSSSVSELSSLHEGENNFRQTFRNVQKKALPAIPDIESKPEPQCNRDKPPSPEHYHDNLPSPQHYRDNLPSRQTYHNSPPSPRRYRNNPPSPQHYHDNPPSPQRYRDKPPSPQRYRDKSPSPQRYCDKPPSPRHHRQSPPLPQRYRDNPPRHCQDNPPSPQYYQNNSPSPQPYRDVPDSELRLKLDKPPSQRRYSDDPPAPAQSRRPGAKHVKNHNDSDQNRWKPRSEHLQRKAYCSDDRSVSLDELEEFAISYTQRSGRASDRREENYDVELHQFSKHLPNENGLSQHYYTNEHHLENYSDHEDHHRRKNRRDISPLPSPKKRRGTWDTDRPVPSPPKVSPPSSSSQEKDYDATFLNSLLERKAKLRGVSQGKGSPRGDEASDTPSKGSCKQSSGESHRYNSHSQSNRPNVDSDTERNRIDRPMPGLDSSRSPQSSALSQPGRREESREKPRKMNTLLSRDSLIV